MNLQRPVLVLLAALLWTGAALAQVDLVTFSSGQVLEASDLNQNFDNLATAVDANRVRADALAAGRASGAAWVTREDLPPAQGAQDFTYSSATSKAELVLTGTTNNSGDQFCFRGRVDLPDGATITEFAALLEAPSGQTPPALAEAYLQTRAWTQESYDTLASLGGSGSGFSEAATTGGSLPATVDAEGRAYFVTVCLEGDGGFLSGRVSYDLP